MPIPEIDEFAKILIEKVRDAAIQSNDRALTAEHALTIRWKEAAANSTPEGFARTLIPDIVDDTLFHLLSAIDHGLLKLSFTASNGKIVNLSDEGFGELAGWYMGSDSWRAHYAKERFVDDFSDLNGRAT